MLVQAIHTVTLPDGRQLRRGEVADVPDSLAGQLLRQGIVRERVNPPALERKEERDDIVPETPFSAPEFGPVLSFQNEDNFIKNLVTIAWPGGAYITVSIDGSYVVVPADGSLDIPLTPTLAGRDPVLTLEEIKRYLRIDADYTDEDVDIQRMEQSAHAACENALRRVGQIDATCGENIKAALLWDIAFQWEHRDPTETMPADYNREAMFLRWLPGERDYPLGVY